VGIVVIVVIAAAVVYGGGASAVLPKLANIGAWLANDKDGSVTHANGLSGQADARVRVSSANGHHLRVIQDGGTVLVEDLDTGVVSRVDPAQLTVSQTVTYNASGTQLVLGGGHAYFIDPSNGFVQAIDPQQLRALGPPMPLPGQLGQAAVDGTGTAWVPILDQGTVVPVTDAGPGAPVSVGSPHDVLHLTIAAGRPVVTDPTSGTLSVVSTTAGANTVRLPANATSVLTPDATPNADVPMISPDTDTMVLVDTSTGVPTSVTLPQVSGDDLGAPEVLGSRVYVPDNTTGRLIVYDEGTGQLLNQIPVTQHAPTQLEVFVHDGVLWANDASSPDAIAIDSTGAVHPIGKYAGDLPGGPLPTPSPGNGGHRSHNGNGNGNGGGHTGGGTTSSPPPPTQPPGSVTETPQDGSILVSFTPITSPAPINYTISGMPANVTSNPASLTPGTGNSSFVVSGSGLSCDAPKPYVFTVVAHFSNGTTSASGGGALPCRPPDAPGTPSLSVPGQHSAGASWTAPADHGGQIQYYVVDWGPTSSQVSGTTASTGGLTNFSTYTVSVKAHNGAGDSPSSNGAQVSISPGNTWPGVIYNNAVYAVNVRHDPNTGAQIMGHFNPPGGESVSVICYYANGGSWKDPSGSPSGNSWYRVTYPGYIATGYVNVHGAGVWDC
jgi:hypothetical protein